MQSDGKILVGGLFTTIGGQSRSVFARLSNDTAALSTLTVTKTTITLTRNGSATQFTRVTFEQSTDNGATYTPLGDGTPGSTPPPSRYTLTGQNLPNNQNILIRARGFYRTGYQNGSESIEEKVQNAFIVPPPTPTLVVSRQAHGGVGTFDINLPLTGSPGIECRSGGASNDYQVVFIFPSAVTFTSAGVTTGTGLVSSGSGTTTVTANLTGVTNAQTITVTLIGVNNAGNVSVPMGVLVGDTNASRSVSASDISQTKAQAGQPVTASNFREDVTANGSITASDISLVKSLAGTSLPPVANP